MKVKDIELQQEIADLQLQYEQVKKNLHRKKLLNTINISDLQEIGNLMNAIGMKHSQNGSHSQGQQWLKKVLKYSQYSNQLKLITLNNLSCVYRQSNNLPLALLYIKKAQKFSQQISDDRISTIITDCSLNFCAILSSMKEHKKALLAVRKAQSFLKEAKQMKKVPLAYYDSVYPIIKYNEAVELQNLKKYQESLKCYESARTVAKPDTNLFERIEEGRKTTLNASQKKLSLKKSSSQKRKSFQGIKDENILLQGYGKVNRLPGIGQKLRQTRQKEFFSTRKLNMENSYLALQNIQNRK